MNDGTNERTEGNPKKEPQKPNREQILNKMRHCLKIFFEYNLLLNRDTFFDFRIFLKKSEHFSSQFRGGFLRRFHTFCIWFFYTSFRTYIFWFLGIPSHLFFLPAKGHLKKWFTASRRILSEGHFFAQLFTDLYFSQCFPKAIFVWQFFSVFLNSQIFV